MDRTYHFLAGLPRSGNTLLSALLNQNPDIYSTPISPIPTYLWDLSGSVEAQETLTRNVENKRRSEIFLSSFLDNYYKDVQKPVVIDRQKVWGTPANLGLIKKYVTPTPKVIFTVRDILEILASFVKFDPQYLKNEIFEGSYYMSNYRLPKDTICEYLMCITKQRLARYFICKRLRATHINGLRKGLLA
jgi:sulfotransferase